MIGCPQSVENVSPSGVPIAFFNLSMNHSQFLLVSEINYTNSYWIHPIVAIYCTSNTQLTLNLPFKNVLSTARYGLHPLRKPSTHGFIAKNNLLNLILFVIV
jgi:hypothetical protein